MKLPRDITGKILAKKLVKFGHQIERQTGSHLRLKTNNNGIHFITVPNHSPIKVGTLNAILKEICDHFDIDRDSLIEHLF